MPPSAALATVDAVDTLDTADIADDIRIRPLTEHQSARPLLRLVPSRPRPEVPLGVLEVRRLLVAVLEILDGRRSVKQLTEILPRHCRGTLLRAGGGVGPRSLRSLRLARTTDDAVDLYARVDQRGRSRALTGRLEHVEGRWRFTLLLFV